MSVWICTDYELEEARPIRARLGNEEIATKKKKELGAQEKKKKNPQQKKYSRTGRTAEFEKQREHPIRIYEYKSVAAIYRGIIAFPLSLRSLPFVLRRDSKNNK